MLVLRIGDQTEAGYQALNWGKILKEGLVGDSKIYNKYASDLGSSPAKQIYSFIAVFNK